MNFVINMNEQAGLHYTVVKYPAGERQVRLTELGIELIGRATGVTILHRGVPDVMELVLLCDAVGRVAEFTPVRLVLPYLPYARADRRFVDGDCAGLAVFGNLLNGLGLQDILTLDVHSNKALRLVPRLRNATALAQVHEVYQQVWNASVRPTILLPDEGSKHRYSLPLNWSVKYCTKVRDAQTGALSAFQVPDLLNDAVLIVDDICDGGGTFIGIAKAIEERYINLERVQPDLYLYVTHGIFSKGLTPLLEHFEHIYTTDSLPNFFPMNPKLTVLEAVKDLL